MAKILKTRIGQHKGARIRLESGQILTHEDIMSLEEDIVYLVVDAGTYDPVSGSVVGGSQPVDISILSELTIPIERLTIGGQFIYTMPDLSNWTALRTLTIMNTSIEQLDESVYDLSISSLTLQDNPQMTYLDPDLNTLSSLQTLQLQAIPLEDMTWISQGTDLNMLRWLYLVDMQQMFEFPQDILYFESLEYLSVDNSAFVVSQDDINELLENTSLSVLDLNPDQIDFDLEEAEQSLSITIIDDPLY